VEHVARLEVIDTKATIDRVEGHLAVLLLREDESIRFEIPISLMPPGSKEGDIVDIQIEKDETTTQETRERVSSLIEKLKSKGQK
jgi:hypothetical protein